MNVLRTGEKRVCFSTFSHLFFHTFHFSTYFPMLNERKFVFQFEIEIAYTYAPENMTIQCIASVSTAIYRAKRTSALNLKFILR